jgi:hypothetical protein
MIELQGNRESDVLLINGEFYGDTLAGIAQSSSTVLQALHGFRGLAICTTPVVVHERKCERQNVRIFTHTIPRQRHRRREWLRRFDEGRACDVLDTFQMLVSSARLVVPGSLASPCFTRIATLVTTAERSLAFRQAAFDPSDRRWRCVSCALSFHRHRTRRGKRRRGFSHIVCRSAARTQATTASTTTKPMTDL